MPESSSSIVLPPPYTAVETLHNNDRFRILRATDADGLPLVLKIPFRSDPGVQQRLRNELEQGRTLADAFAEDPDLAPHRLAYLDLVQSKSLALDQRPVLVMEDVGGRSLDQDLPNGGLELELWLNLAIQMANILGAIHRQRLIHRQIQPAHMILGSDGHLRWIGLGQSSVAFREHVRAVPPRQLESTLAYLSPEQTGRMNRAVDYRSDFYSLGISLYQLLTGRLPFPSRDIGELIHSHLAKTPPSPHQLRPSLPIVLVDILNRLLAKNAEDRYQSSAGLLHDLKRCRDHFELSGKIPAFPLSKKEKIQHFELPERLYGRDRDIERLLRSFERSRAKPELGVEILLIEGASGTGKSVLPLELYKPITRDRGHLVSGRFDPFRKDIPFSAWAQAFSDLCRHLLTEPPHSLDAWRRRIEETVDAALMPALVELIPRLSLILGLELEGSETKSTAETANRFLLALRRLVAAFSTPRHPLVILLDNMHLADDASLRFLEELAIGEPIPHCLVLLTYQLPQEQGPHPLLQSVSRIEEISGKIEAIHLKDLSQDHVTQLIADAFGTSLAKAQPLAGLVHSKTAGNPHFVRQFLISLHDHGLLTLQSENYAEATTIDSHLSDAGSPSGQIKWVWDLEGARALSITDNMVELLSLRINNLIPESRNILKMASCLGGSFELGTLATVADQGRGATLRQLGPCLRNHFVITIAAPLQESSDDTATVSVGREEEGEKRWFRFSHEKIRQTAYSALSDSERQHMHLRIARRLHAGDDTLSRKFLFETLSHYLHAEPQVTDPNERIRILELALAAGEKALGSGAYPTAAAFLESGLSTLDEDLWSVEPALVFELHRAAFHAFGLANRLEQADSLFAQLSERSLERSERLAICRIRLEQLTTRGLYVKALEVSAEALGILGMSLPRDEITSQRELQQDLDQLPALLAGRSIEDLQQAPPLTDPIQGQVLSVLGAVATCAFPSGRPQLVAWAGCRRVRIILEHGLQSADAPAFASFGYSTLIYAQKDYDAAYRYGQLAIRVVENSSSLSARARTLIMFAGSIQHWKEPLTESLPNFRKALRYALESGDLIFAGYAVCFLFFTRFQTGTHLAELHQEAQQQVAFLDRSYQTSLEGVFRPALLQPIAHLLGQSQGTDSFEGAEFSEQAFLEGPGQIPYFQALYLGAKIRGLYWMQHIPEALDLVEQRDHIEQALYAQAQLPEYLLFIGLTLTAAFDAVDEEDQHLFLEILDDYEQRFALWSELCPENGQHRYFLLTAERSRIAGDFEKAAKLYRQAIDVAAASKLVQYEALANELFGNFWQYCGEPTAAIGYWLRARDLYAQWGAQTKVDHLQRSHAELISLGHSPETQSSAPEVGLSTELDLGHALRASRAISGEVRPDELLQALMRSVIETAGARRGCLLLKRDGALTIEVTVSVGREGKAPEVHVGSIPLDDHHQIAQSVVRFVSRTEEDVVLGDASASARFGADPRLVRHRIPSVLCLPMKRHRELVGALYLENRLAAHVFTAERVGLLHTLLAQAAISLENARLYESLAREVHERKLAEDQQRAHNTELESKNAELERFTYTVSHDLRSPLVTIKGFLGLLGEDVEAGHLESVREDIARISKATDHMSELLEDLLDLSRVGRLAGPPSEIPLLELIQETLELLTIPLANAGIEIQMKPPFPIVYGDRVRLREVLQNLIENATKFMGDQRHPRIEIGTCAQKENDETAIFVRDNGAGIKVEHQEVIFGLFQQLNQNITGTGVGLTLVQRIVEVHGGRVWVESEGMGLGSTFFFTLGTPD